MIHPIAFEEHSKFTKKYLYCVTLTGCSVPPSDSLMILLAALSLFILLLLIDSSSRSLFSFSLSVYKKRYVCCQESLFIHVHVLYSMYTVQPGTSWSGLFESRSTLTQLKVYYRYFLSIKMLFTAANVLCSLGLLTLKTEGKTL